MILCAAVSLKILYPFPFYTPLIASSILNLYRHNTSKKIQNFRSTHSISISKQKWSNFKRKLFNFFFSSFFQQILLSLLSRRKLQFSKKCINCPIALNFANYNANNLAQRVFNLET